MNSVIELFQVNTVFELVGLALIHFLWQAVVVWLLVLAATSLVSGSKANLRYCIFASGMLAMLLCPFVTVALLYPSHGFVETASSDLVGMPWEGPANVASDELSESSLYQAEDLNPLVDLPVASETIFSPVALATDILRNLSPWLVAFWGIGVLLHMIRLIFGVLQVRRWKTDAFGIEEKRLLTIFEKLKRQMKVRSAHLMETKQLNVAAVIGVWKPVVLIPSALISGMSMKEIELVLAHELAHVRRWDYFVNIVQRIVESLLFFHPAVWWLSKQISQEREHCCDDIAASVCDDRVGLAKALANMETIRCRQDLALTANGGNLSSRIQRLLCDDAQSNRSSWPVGIVMTTLFVVLLWSVLPGGAEVAVAETEAEWTALSDVDSESEIEEAEDDEPEKMSKFEVRKRDPVTGIEQLVFDNIRLAVKSEKGKAEASVGLKYSNVIPYTFLPARVVKSLNATKVGEIDFAKHKPVKDRKDVSQIFMPNDFSKPTGFRKDGVAGVYVDFVTELKSDQEIVPYATDALWAPDHMGFYGLNKTKQTKFDVVRIDEFDLGIGKTLGPFNALVLSDENSAFGLLGSVLCSRVRGKDGESLWHLAATNEFRLMKRTQKKKVEKRKDGQKNSDEEQPVSDGFDSTKLSTELMQLIGYQAGKNGMNELSIRSVDVGRTPTELLRHFKMLIERRGSPERMDSITNMESIVSAVPTSRQNNSITATEVLFNLPEGSKSRAAILGESIQMGSDADRNLKLTITGGSLQWIDSVGVIRAEAKPVEESNKLAVVIKIDLNEVVMKISCAGRVEVLMNSNSGAPDDEGQPPHGSVRYEILDADAKNEKPLRMKMKWRYDVARLAQEAEAESGKTWQQIIWGDDYKEQQKTDSGDSFFNLIKSIEFTYEVRKYQLKHVSPGDAERAVKKWVADQNELLNDPLNLKIAIDHREKALVASGDVAFLNEVNELLKKIDVPSDSAGPWRVFGKVTNERGEAISGVAVKAHCGMGTLFETGSDHTDAQGRFDFTFGPGIFSENKQMVQAATISVSLDGHVEKNLHRQGGLVAALEKPDGEIGWGGMTEDQLFLPGKPIELNFVMVKSLTIKGLVVDKDGKRRSGLKVSLKGKDQPPSWSGAAFAETDEEGRYVLSGVPAGYEYQILVRPKKRGHPWLAWASAPITFVHGETNDTHINYSNDGTELDLSFQDFHLFLKGEGENWKSALKNASDRALEVKWDGLSAGNKVRAGSAWIEL